MHWLDTTEYDRSSLFDMLPMTELDYVLPQVYHFMHWHIIFFTFVTLKGWVGFRRRCTSHILKNYGSVTNLINTRNMNGTWCWELSREPENDVPTVFLGERMLGAGRHRKTCDQCFTWSVLHMQSKVYYLCNIHGCYMLKWGTLISSMELFMW